MHAYDTCDRLVEVAYPGDRVDEIEPDPFGRVLGVTEGAGSAAPRVITYQRDPNGHVTAMGWASGYAGFNYDEFDRLTSWGTTEDDRRNYSYDPFKRGGLDCGWTVRRHDPPQGNRLSDAEGIR